MEHLLERPKITPDRVSPDERIAQAYKVPGGVGLMDDSLAGYIFQQQASGRWTQEEADEAYDAHAEIMKVGTMGAGAAAVSAAADITAMAVAIGANVYNMSKGESWAWPENMRNVPATSDWWGAQLGLTEEQTSSLAFLGGSLAIAPSRALDNLDSKTVSTILKTAKAFGGGTRKAAIAQKRQAAKLFREGADADTVWQETGWFPTKVDGVTKWKFYISDADANVNMDAVVARAGQKPGVSALVDGDRIEVKMQMSEVLDHQALYELYPEIAGYPISVWVEKAGDTWVIPANKGKALADWNPQTRKFNLHSAYAKDPMASARESLLHEAQHAIQTLEGWTDGASAPAMKDAVTQFKAGRFMSEIYNNPEPWEFTPPEDIAKFVEAMGFDEGEASAMVKEVARMIDGTVDESEIAERLSYWKRIESKGGDEAARWLSTAIHMGDDKLTFIENMSIADANVLAYMRYNLDLGEMEARLSQAVSKLDQAQIDTMPINPHSLMGAMQNKGLWRMLSHMYPDLKKMQNPAPAAHAITDRSVAKIEEAGLLKDRIDFNLPEVQGAASGSAASPLEELQGILAKLEENDPTLARKIMMAVDEAPTSKKTWHKLPESIKLMGVTGEQFNQVIRSGGVRRWAEGGKMGMVFPGLDAEESEMVYRAAAEALGIE